MRASVRILPSADIDQELGSVRPRGRARLDPIRSHSSQPCPTYSHLGGAMRHRSRQSGGSTKLGRGSSGPRRHFGNSRGRRSNTDTRGLHTLRAVSWPSPAHRSIGPSELKRPTVGRSRCPYTRPVFVRAGTGRDTDTRPLALPRVSQPIQADAESIATNPRYIAARHPVADLARPCAARIRGARARHDQREGLQRIRQRPLRQTIGRAG
jgi:hypothetical protein